MPGTVAITWHTLLRCANGWDGEVGAGGRRQEAGAGGGGAGAGGRSTSRNRSRRQEQEGFSFSTIRLVVFFGLPQRKFIGKHFVQHQTSTAFKKQELIDAA